MLALFEQALKREGELNFSQQLVEDCCMINVDKYNMKLIFTQSDVMLLMYPVKAGGVKERKVPSKLANRGFFNCEVEWPLFQYGRVYQEQGGFL